MKYSESNKPIVCMQTNSTCYKGTTPMTPKGVLWHSTGANNTAISRYVQPFETDDNYEEMITILGKNKYKNDWNHKKRNAGMNCWIGKLADGTVTTVQTMPWNYMPWGCGAGKKGSLNNTHMQFEICEDSLKNREYFEAIYKEACEITAYYCKMYNLDPFGTFIYKGVVVPVITTHDESYDLKLGSNHGDPIKWMRKHGKTIEDVRRDVAALMGTIDHVLADNNTVTLRTLKKGYKGEDVRALQILLSGRGCNGNMYKPDGKFGPNTLGAVKLFQQKAGLVVDGVAGKATWGALLGQAANAEGTFEMRTLSKGMSGEDVRALQILLSGRGCNGNMHAPDGIFGPNTLGAVKLFQGKNGLSTDGIAGYLTWNELLGM